MEINRAFNWGSGQIRTDGLSSKPAEPKKKGFFSKIKDAFSPSASIPQMPSMKESVAKTFTEFSKSSLTETKKIGYETAYLVALHSQGIEDSNLFQTCNSIVSGSIGGPIGFALPGLTLNPLLSDIKINNPVIAEKVMINSILLMEDSEDPAVQELFPKAVEEFARRASSDGTTPERGEAADKILTIINTPGISPEDKKSISRDALLILKGQEDPMWVLSESVNHYKNGSPSSIEFAKYLNDNMEKTLQPVTEKLKEAAEGKTGEHREKEILNAAKGMISGESPENKALIAFQALKTIASGSSPNSGKACELSDLMVNSHNSTIASAYADMILGGSSPTLDPDMPTLISTGKAMNRLFAGNDFVGESAVRWFDSYLRFMEKKTDNPVEKQMIQTGLNIHKKLPLKAQSKLSSDFFETFSDTKKTGAALIASIGTSQISGFPVKYSQDRKYIINTAKEFIDEIAGMGGAAGKFANQVSQILNSMPDAAGANFVKYTLSEIQKGISYPEKTVACIANQAIDPLSDQYGNDRKIRGDAVKTVLNTIIDSSGDSGIVKTAKIAMESIDVTPSEWGFRNGQDALSLIANDKISNPTEDMAGIFYKNSVNFSEEYQSDRFIKTEMTSAYLKILRDNETDPAVRARLDRTIDTIETIEEKLPDKDGNKTITVSDCRSYSIGLDVLKNINQGVNPDSGTEISSAGLKMIKLMAFEYSSERDRKAIVCNRFYKSIENHADNPDHKQTAEAFRELLEKLRGEAVQTIGLGGLDIISANKPFSLSVLAEASLKHCIDISSMHSKLKSDATRTILQSIQKYAKNDRENKILNSGRKIFDDLETFDYGFNIAPPILEALKSDNNESIGLILSQSGKSFVDNNYDWMSKEERIKKTKAAKAFLSQIVKVADKQTQRGLALMISLYCEKEDKEKGYMAALAAFDAIAEMENLPDNSDTMKKMMDEIGRNSPPEDESWGKLINFMKKSLGSIYLMQDTLDKVGEAGKEIKREEEFVIIGGVKVKKRKSVR